MKKINQFVIGSIFILVSAAVLADDHEMFAGDLNPVEPMSIQANICTLNDGVSVDDYRFRVSNGVKNDADVTSVTVSASTHNNPNNPYPADFVSFS